MADRAARLVERVAAPPAEAETAAAELMLVSSLLDVRYLTGYTGSSGLAIVGPDTRVFVTDFRYVEQATAEVDPSFQRVIAERELIREVPGLLPGGERRLGFQDGAMTVRAHRELSEMLPAAVTLVPAGDLLRELRAVKDPDELSRIRASAELADAALREIMEQGLAGRTETEVALALEDAMRRRGASGASFDSIVAAGAHAARPHAVPREVAIGPDELVVIDWGAVLDGYCSDCTRTFATGPLPEPALLVYELVLEAQLTALETIRPGTSGRDADAAARTLIAQRGHGEHFGHSLGHGVGLEVHEGPNLSTRSKDTLRAGNVVTVEPGVYVPGEVGVRIEDLCAVTEAGAEILTGIPKELITLG